MRARSSPIGEDLAAGFTLIELLVVLAIVGVLLAAAPALISAGRPAADVKSAALGFASELRAARGLAVTSETETRVAIDITDGAYAAPGRPVRRLSRQIGLRFRGPQAEVHDGKAFIRFFPDGSSTGGELVLSENGRVHRVEVRWLTGRISVDE